MAKLNYGFVPPNNLQAEESLIGAALLTSKACEILVNQTDIGDFYKVSHQIIVSAIKEMWAENKNVDPVTLSNALNSIGKLDTIGGSGVLVALQAGCPATSNAKNYADIVVDHAVRRRMIHASSQALELSKNLDIEIEELFNKIQGLYGDVEIPLAGAEPDMNVQEFLRGPEDYNWLIQGLMEQRDRLILTGGEGTGKSVFIRQLAVCAAAGVHPFRNTPIDPIKVLLIDCENSEVQCRRKLRPMVARARSQTAGSFDPDNLRINVKLDGLDLMQRQDVRWLMERVDSNQPQLLLIGPLYKLHAGDPIDEAPARHVSIVFDKIRQKYECALIIEAHSPYTTVDGNRLGRPYGASLWSRWPEFGFCLAKNPADPNERGFEPWRGPRDEREWPEKLVKGLSASKWPWVVPEGAYQRKVDYGQYERPLSEPEF